MWCSGERTTEERALEDLVPKLSLPMKSSNGWPVASLIYMEWLLRRTIKKQGGMEKHIQILYERLFKDGSLNF